MRFLGGDIGHRPGPGSRKGDGVPQGRRLEEEWNRDVEAAEKVV